MTDGSDEDRDPLKEDLMTISKWLKENTPLDDAKNAMIDSTVNRLNELEDNESSALMWAFGKVILSGILHEDISENKTIGKICVSLVTSIELMNHTDLYMIKRLWQWIKANNYVSGFLKTLARGESCLYIAFLNKSFKIMKTEGKLANFVSSMIKESFTPLSIDSLLDHKRLKTVLPEILDVLFMQLVQPSCQKAKETVQWTLKPCWNIANSVREMFHDALANEDYKFQSSDRVYHVILELLTISKDLVVGLINNTVLCLQRKRNDRLIGLKFFCYLFGHNRFSGFNMEVHSRLWQEFLLQNVSLHEPSELMMLAKYTPLMLSQPSAHRDWCKLLIYLFGYTLPSKCEMAFVLGILKSLKNIEFLANDDNPESLLCLVKKFLTPGSPYQRHRDARTIFLEGLGASYMEAAKQGVNDLTLQSVHHYCSKLLSCFFGTCRSFVFPTNEKWCALRKLFVRNLVPYEEDAETRMKMLFYLWINTSSDDQEILHELFSKTVWTRKKMINIFHILQDNETFKAKMSFLPKLLRQLLTTLPEEDVPGTFLKKSLFPALKTSRELRSLLNSLILQPMSCDDNHKNSLQLENLFASMKDVDMNMAKGLVNYIAELTFDTESVKCLLRLVKSCVEGNELCTALHLRQDQVAQSALRLLNEVLCMLPNLGFDADIVRNLILWSKRSQGSLSHLSLRCLVNLGSSEQLDQWDYSLTMDEILPFWFHIIDKGSREQVKMAMKCISCHLSIHRDKTLHVLLKHIISFLYDPHAQDRFIKGVSALGHFAAICPDPLKGSVESTCISVLINDILSCFQEEELNDDCSVSVLSNDSWIDWRELPHHISNKVEAMRSIGRCMRFCGSIPGGRKALDSLQAVLRLKKGCAFQNYREIDLDRFRCEAALAILNMFEAGHEFQSMISRPLLIALSKIIMDTRSDVRHLFAKKLGQGLSPLKSRSSANGHSRGQLPLCFLGILPLMGSDLWQKNNESKQIAEVILKQVCVSRHLDVLYKKFYDHVPPGQPYVKEPALVLENILALAVPILAENFLSNIDEDETADLEPYVSVTKCLAFACSIMTHPDTYGGQVSRDYMIQMSEGSKQRLQQCDEIKKYSAAFDLLPLVTRHYKTKQKHPVMPPLVLSHPYFSDIARAEQFPTVLSPLLLRKVGRLVFHTEKETDTEKETEFDQSCVESESDVDTSILDSEISIMSAEQSFQS